MSILLRKECQPVLDAANLEMLHVAIHNKMLTLDGECGKTIVSLSGIQFLTNQPKMKEIDYAVELFKTFITNHKAKIQHYVSKAQELQAIPKPELKDYPNLTSPGYSTAPYLDGKLSVNRALEVESIRESMPLDKLIHTYNAHIDEAKSYFDALSAYKHSNDELTSLESEINKCNI